MCSASRLSLWAMATVILPLDSQLMRDHCRLRLSRGRPMIEPGPWPVLDGQQITSITPVYSDEEIRIGQTALKLETQPRHRELNASRFGAMVGVSPQIQQIFGMLKLLLVMVFQCCCKGRQARERSWQLGPFMTPLREQENHLCPLTVAAFQRISLNLSSSDMKKVLFRCNISQRWCFSGCQWWNLVPR